MPASTATPRTVATGGLGAIGLTVAHAVDLDPRGYDLLAVAGGNLAGAQSKVAGFRKPPQVVEPAQLPTRISW